MLIEIVLALAIGIIVGTFTGLCPGIHINLVAAMLLASIGKFAGVPVIALVVFVVVMSIAHNFMDFIPSIFLGAPNEDNYLSVLPGHRLLMEGKGYEAVVWALYGGLFALPIMIVLSGIFILFLPPVYGFIKLGIVFILIFVSLYMVLREKNFVLAGIIFLLSGLIGWLSFNLPVREPLLPLLSGLFGISGILVSIGDKVVIPEQKILRLREIKLGRRVLRGGLAAGIAAPLCSFLPGIGSGHAAVLGSEFVKQDDRGFLFLVGAVSVIVMSLSFVVAQVLGKGRTGSAVAVQKLLETISLGDLGIILGAIVASGMVAFFVGIFIARWSAKNIERVNYVMVSWIVLGIILVVNLILSNWYGIIVLVTGSALGVFCIESRARRIQMMGALILPSIVYYLI